MVIKLVRARPQIRKDSSVVTAKAQRTKVLKHRLVKFITRCVTKHQTQTDISMSDDDSHGDRYVSSHSKQNVADQNSEESDGPQTETDNQSSDQTEGGDQSTRYPKRNRRAPQYLTDYVPDVECVVAISFKQTSSLSKRQL